MSVYLFAKDFPEYEERMEAIALYFKMAMKWDRYTEFELVPMVPRVLMVPTI